MTKPNKIYIAIDGPRGDNSHDLAAVAACHKVVDEIDWDADIITQFQEQNLGCGKGVSAALSWFFAQEERGIILEDDVLPRESFFGFCSELLDRYQHDERVLAISGCNFVPPEFQSNPANPYRFSRVPHIWGWATWRRAWSLHRLDMTDWRQRLSIRQLWDVTGRSPQGFMFWRAIFNLMAQEKIDTWDMQFVFEGMARNMLTATSNTNLIDNVGFGSLATHTHEQPPYLRPSQDIDLPVRDVPVEVDERADAWSRKVVFGASTRGLVEQAFRYLRQRN